MRAAWTLVLAVWLAVFNNITLAFNITEMLADIPEFSSFNNYLTTAGVANDINMRTAITVCAVDNAVMDMFLARHPSNHTIRNALSFHVILDYYDGRKLHGLSNGATVAATLFQEIGTGQESSGWVNITQQKGGRVVFSLSAEDDITISATFMKDVKSQRYNISVIQISQLLWLDAVEDAAEDDAEDDAEDTGEVIQPPSPPIK